MLKATSQAALQSMESSLNILQDLRDLQVNTVIAHHKHKSVSPLGMFEKNYFLFLIENYYVYA